MAPVEENEVFKRKAGEIETPPDAFLALTPRDESPSKKGRFTGKLSIYLKHRLIVSASVILNASVVFLSDGRR